ncbi:MAG: GGDEF domain-containing protein [Clostridium baratii]|uniref:GGDEF domain-containing protein n=1 Tax=Clostridium baratii TaxID=1561 RepID=UPI00242C05B0|nr:GGDEF domain-containing protein [Clostridium baratii]MBS6042589.1 GGDEF domain-containing protein [Clostridium baratii]
MNILKDISERLFPFKNLYDVIRLVDPINNKVIDSYPNNLIEDNKSLTCYKFWSKDEPCENCTSLNAYIENNTFYKVEVKDDELYMVISSPFEINDTTYVVELIKNITKSGYFKDNDYDDSLKNMFNIISDLLHKDDLTGVYTKKFMYDSLTKELATTYKSFSFLSVMMIDIDFFKRFNDTYGHLLGDEVLKDFVKIISSCIKDENALFGRFGGEEFILILKHNDVDKIKKLGKNILTSVENHLFKFDDISIKLTCSLGVYTVAAKDCETSTMENIVHSADSNLYSAKKLGRNKMITSHK